MTRRTFAPLSVVVAVQGQYDGLGVGIFDGLSAVDIDHCVDENGLSELAADIIKTMDAYAEISPSGKGVRILFRAAGFAYDKNAYFINNQKAGLEVYVAGATQKYVTVTGNAITSERGLPECGPQLQIVLDKYMRRSTQTISPPLETGAAALDDDTLLQKARGGKTGERFTALYDHGVLSAYKSHSEADQALCNMLAFYCGNNPQQVDRLFRNSALYRDK